MELARWKMDGRSNKKFWQHFLLELGIILGAILLAYGWNNFHPGQKRQYTIGTTYMTMNNVFYAILNEQLANSVSRHGDRLLTRDPSLEVDKQVKQIDEFIKEKVDLIVIAPVDGNSRKIHRALKKARRSGIKIINVDTEIKWKNDANCTIVTDNYQAGVTDAKYLMKRQKSAKILLLIQSSALSAQQRISGFVNTLKKHPRYQVLDQLETYGQSELALPQVKKYLKNGKAFDTIMALNDQAALGALAAIDAQNVTKPIAIYSVDGSPNMKSLISKNKNAVATVAQSPVKMGKTCAAMSYRLLTGKKVSKKVIIPTQLITKKNINKYSLTGWQ